MTLFDLRVPIVLGPFGGMSSVALTAAVSNAGGLGSFGLFGYNAERIASTASEIRGATAGPFALNLWMPASDEVPLDEAPVDEALATVAPLYERLGVALPEGTPTQVDVLEQLDAVLEARPAVASFVFGMPPLSWIDAAHDRGIRVVGAATTVTEATAIAETGADAVVATGLEAGGHRVSFLHRAEDALIGGISLIPQVVDAVDIPVIAAGGIADRRGVAAALALGASAVQVGTAFLRTRESAASDAHRAALARIGAHDTVLTRAVTGRLARGIRNDLIDTVEAGTHTSFPAQSWVVGALRAEANRRGDGALQSMWAGQSAAVAPAHTAAEVFAELAHGFAPRG